MAIKAVILDLDDTLCLTEEVCFEMENAVLDKIGHPRMTRQAHKKNWGMQLFDAILERAPGVDLSAFRAEYGPIIREWTDLGKLDAIPRVNFDALDQILEMGIQLLVLTSRTHDELAHLLEPDHELASRIEAFYYKDNTEYHKPDPKAFAHVEEAHGWKPDECVYVGDSVGDAIAARGAGLHFVASLESGLRTKADFADFPGTIFINAFPEVVEAVQSLD